MTANPGDMLSTIFLEHDQTNNLHEIDSRLEETGFRKRFPPGARPDRGAASFVPGIAEACNGAGSCGFHGP